MAGPHARAQCAPSTSFEPRGMRTASTMCWMCSGGSLVTLSTAKATMKFTSAPTAPKASGVMPKKLFGAADHVEKSVPFTKKMPLCANT
jgi:hypothetical protein